MRMIALRFAGPKMNESNWLNATLHTGWMSNYQEADDKWGMMALVGRAFSMDSCWVRLPTTIANLDIENGAARPKQDGWIQIILDDGLLLSYRRRNHWLEPRRIPAVSWWVVADTARPWGVVALMGRSYWTSWRSLVLRNSSAIVRTGLLEIISAHVSTIQYPFSPERIRASLTNFRQLSRRSSYHNALPRAYVLETHSRIVRWNSGVCRFTISPEINPELNQRATWIIRQ